MLHVSRRKRTGLNVKELYISKLLSFYHWYCIRKRNMEKDVYSNINISERVMKFVIDVATER